MDATKRSWRAMLGRVSCKKSKDYTKYSVLGVCQEWNPKEGGSFDAFLKDMGERPQGTTLDRIDNEKGYFKENCRWARRELQNLNRSMPIGPSGMRGVTAQPSGRWRASLKRGGVTYHLGVYATRAEAALIWESTSAFYNFLQFWT